MTESNGQAPEPKHDLSRMLIKLNADPEDILRIRLKEAEPQQSRSFRLKKGRWVPILVAVLVLGLAAILLLWPGSPLCHVLDRCGTAAEDVWTIEITPSEQDVSPEGLLSEMLTISVLDGEGNARADEMLLISTDGSGTLEPQGTNAGIVHNQKLTIGTRGDGARVRYTSAKSGDMILVVLEERQERRVYIVPDAPTPPPTPTPPGEPPTPTPLPPALSLNIDATVDGQQTDVAQPGQLLTYSVQVANSGPAEARDVGLQCRPPNGAKLESSPILMMNQDGGFSRQGIVIPPDSPINVELAFTVLGDALDGATFELGCSLTYAGTTITEETSPPIRLERPANIRITLQPDTLDIGIGESVDLRALVQFDDAGGAPVPDRELSVQIDQAELLVVPANPVTTDPKGEAVIPLTGGQVAGQGQITVGLGDDSATSSSAILIVRPIARIPLANIRSTPPNGNELTVSAAIRANPFKVVGQLPDGSWLLVLLPDDSTGWVAKSTENSARTVFIGDLATVPIVQPGTPWLPGATPTQEFGVSPGAGQRRLKDSGDGLVDFRVVYPTSRVLVALPVPGSVDLVNPDPTSDLYLVTVQFWVQRQFVKVESGNWKLMNPGSNDFACWEVPSGNPTTEAQNCGFLYTTGQDEILLSSASAPPESNGWRQVTIQAWVPEQNIE